MGLIDDMNTFTTAQVRYDAAAVGTIVYNIDDIVPGAIPEPGSMMVLALSTLALIARRKRY